MSARRLTVYDPAVWDRRNRARPEVENLPLEDVLAVLAQHEDRYVVVELWPCDVCASVPLLTAKGFLVADQRCNPLKDDGAYAPPAHVVSYYYDLWQSDETAGAIQTGRFTIDALHVVDAYLQGDSRADPPKLHVEHCYGASRLSLCVNLDPGRPYGRG
jgi:hypothetical protein